jgi:tetratricopeptide (TPR) repeat protein
MRWSGVFVVLSCAVSGCATHRVAFRTEPPEASVRLLNQESGLYEEAGKTPLTIDGETSLPIPIRSSDVVAVMIEKEGFVPQHFLVDLAANPDVTLNVRLAEIGATGREGANPKSFDEFGRRVQLINSLVAARNLQQAYGEARALSDAFATSAVAWDIRGSLEVLLNHLDMAQASYRKSLQIDPNNAETLAALAAIGEKR